MQLPIIHIDQLAKQLELERRWIVENWLSPEKLNDSAGPAPCWRDGRQIFFEVEELQQWAKRRSLGSDFTDIETDLSD